jgi:hypothetical protein
MFCLVFGVQELSRRIISKVSTVSRFLIASSSTLKMEVAFSQKRRLIFNGLRVVISRKQ